jgi:hypothetical protein
VFVASVTVTVNMQLVVAGAVVEKLGFPLIVPVTVVMEGAPAVRLNPAQLPTPPMLLVNVRFPVPGAPAVPALTMSE